MNAQERIQPKFERWVETAHKLVHSSTDRVACPCCNSPSLRVKDVEYGFGHEKGVQRYISCGCCGAFTGINMKRAGEMPARPLMQAAE